MQHNRVCTPPPSRERSATPSRSFAWSACAWSPPLPLVAAGGTTTMTCCATTNKDCSYNDDHCDHNSNNSSSSMHRCGDGVCRMDDSTHDAPIERRLGLDADSPWLLPQHTSPPPSAHTARGVDAHDTPTRRCLLPSHSAQLQHDDDADDSDACMRQRLSSLRACTTAATHPSPPLPLLTRDDAMRYCSFGYGNKENKNDDDTAVDDCNNNDDNSAQRRRQRVSVHAVYATSSPSYAPRLIDDDDEAQQQQQTPRVSCSAVTHAGDDAMLLMLHGPQASSTAAAAPSCTSATTTTAMTATPSAALLLYTPQVDSTRIALRRQLDAEVEATNAVWRAQRAQLLLQQQQPSSPLFTSSAAMTTASLCEYVQPPTTVLDGVLYVGGRPDAHTPAATTRLLQQLRALRVRHIVNCCAHECPTSARVRDAFVVHERHASDHDDYLILHHDYDAFAQIVRTAASRGEAVYAHCVAGVNRSVTLCLAYLMDHSDSNNNNNSDDDKGSTRRGCLGCGLSPAEAVQQLRRRGHVRLLDNVGFRHQLVDHYMQRQ